MEKSLFRIYPPFWPFFPVSLLDVFFKKFFLNPLDKKMILW